MQRFSLHRAEAFARAPAILEGRADAVFAMPPGIREQNHRMRLSECGGSVERNRIHRTRASTVRAVG
ncbi:hypothetical protein [Sphingomonas sp. GV3]|uniref:hypothetical protein n=1 Tax=Sphingomonas sp. GV3 TaxID=3040671 RepID=UPI00280ADB8A|nr:hypothetical protein [Sphingomonas sp. GV3]